MGVLFSVLGFLPWLTGFVVGFFWKPISAGFSNGSDFVYKYEADKREKATKQQIAEYENLKMKAILGVQDESLLGELGPVQHEGDLR